MVEDDQWLKDAVRVGKNRLTYGPSPEDVDRSDAVLPIMPRPGSASGESLAC